MYLLILKIIVNQASLKAMEPTNNSFYASFKIYINKLQSVHQKQPPQIVRIEQLEVGEDDVFLETPQNVEVQIKVDPPTPRPPENKQHTRCPI